VRRALGLLTIVPVGSAGPVGAAAGWFPVVGGLIGLLVGAVRVFAGDLVGPGVAGVLAVIVLVVVTGGLHVDGLADCADALGVRGGRERRLAVMRESTIGVFGGLGLLLWGLLLAAAVGGLPRDDAIPAVVVACGLGRWAAVVHAALLGPARQDGLGAAFVVSRLSVGLATAVAVLGAGALVGPGAGAAALAGAGAVALGVGAWAQRALGGRTGDTLGATIVLVEVVVCVILLGLDRPV
jgi:adenosylcobinamide-GDP ribazoletransferase